MVTAGRVLSLGYFDHPPASWWLSWGAAHLFGTEAPWAVRLPFILLFALSQILLWRITCLVAGQRAGFWAVVALNLSPVFGVTTGTWVLPDGPLDAALLAAALCLLHALPATGRQSPGLVGSDRTLCRTGVVFQILGRPDDRRGISVSADQPLASALAGYAPNPMSRPLSR